MKYNELIHARRWEVLAAATTADSIGALCKTLGTSYYATHWALEKLGIKRQWQRGRPRSQTDEHIARNAEIIALRERDTAPTLDKIVNQYGITGERVRQILNAHGRHDLCGSVVRNVEWACINCGKKEMRLPWRTHVKACSIRCAKQNQFPIESSRLILGPRVLELREAGLTWLAIGRRLEIKGKNDPSTTAMIRDLLKRWAKRVGADISHLQRHASARAQEAPRPQAAITPVRHTAATEV